MCVCVCVCVYFLSLIMCAGVFNKHAHVFKPWYHIFNFVLVRVQGSTHSRQLLLALLNGGPCERHRLSSALDGVRALSVEVHLGLNDLG